LQRDEKGRFVKGFHASPSTEFQKGLIPCNKGKPLPTWLKQKISSSLKGRPNLKLRGRVFSEETRKRISQSLKGKPSPFKGRTKELGDPRALKLSQLRKGRKLPRETREKISKATKGRVGAWKGQKRPWLSKLNKTPSFMKKRLKGLLKKPTEPEKKLITLISKHALPFHYTGNGAEIISGLNPDFIHSLGEKKVIEVFGRVFHDPKYGFAKPLQKEEVRKAIYKKAGYSCLIIWDNELVDEASVVRKVMTFGA
jgi:hypothetical protein